MMMHDVAFYKFAFYTVFIVFVEACKCRHIKYEFFVLDNKHFL